MQRGNHLITLDFAERLINSFNGSAHLKELSSGKYFFSNQTNATNIGVSSVQELIGLTVLDIDQHMRLNWGSLASKIVMFDEQLKFQQAEIINDRQISLLPNGFVAIHNMKKLPLRNALNKVTWVLTMSEQVTNRLNLIELYRLYQHLYKHSKLSIQKFISYVKAEDLFYELPTDAEIKTLLYRQRYHTVKAVAEQMLVAPKTVSSHLASLRVKVIGDFSELYLDH
jgi:hypothetical protein